MRTSSSVVVTLLALSVGSVSAQTPSLGTLSFPNSGAPEAQDDFVRGVLLLHSFEYESAAAAFRAAQEADPDFALAYWGEAMTHNHPVWGRQDRDAARAILARYRGTPKTEREALYLEAVEVLFGEGDKAERDQRYMEAMRRLHAAAPDDDEARAFYALSLIGLTNGVRDFANYMSAAAVAQPIFERNPDHPGAAHYLIHAFDDPVHAPLGLPAARAYGDAVPDAGHAQHMTSHIFLAMGMWDDVVRANVNASRVMQEARAERGLAPNYCGHYTSWLAYGYLMKERWEEATRIMDGCQADQAAPDRDDRVYYADMRARRIFDTAEWDGTERWAWDVSDVPRAHELYVFTDGYAALRRGDVASGKKALQALAGSQEPRTRIAVLELEALVAHAGGDADGAVAKLREAAALEESLPFEFGPPASLMPPHEALGDLLLELGRAEDAVEAYQSALKITPGRTPTLRGLARAAHAAGRHELAEEAEAQIRSNTGEPTSRR